MGRINRRIYSRRRKRSSALKLRNDASTGIASGSQLGGIDFSQNFLENKEMIKKLRGTQPHDSTSESQPTINKNDDIFGQMIKQAQIKKSEAAAGQMSQGGGWLSGTYKITKVNDASEQSSEQNFSPRPRGTKAGQLGGLRSIFSQA